MKKLNNQYNERTLIKDDNNNYNNLSNHNLNQDQKEALNFESNY